MCRDLPWEKQPVRSQRAGELVERSAAHHSSPRRGTERQDIRKVTAWGSEGSAVLWGRRQRADVTLNPRATSFYQNQKSKMTTTAGFFNKR